MNDLHVTKSPGDRTQKISSVLTPLFKFGFATTFLIMTVGSILLLPNAFGQAPTVVSLSIVQVSLVCAFLLFLAHLCLRLKRVAAHNNHLVVSKYFTEAPVLYDHIVEIMAYRARSPIFVRLRLQTGCRFGKEIHFLLPSTLAGIPSQPEIQLLREKCPQLSEQSRKWWWPRVYYWKQHARGTQ